MDSGTASVKPVFENLKIKDTFLIKARTVSYNNSTLVEAYREGWGGFETGIKHLYWITTYKGVTRDWGVHKYTTDRYFAVHGEIEVALFEGRKQEPLFGQMSTIILSSDKGEGLVIPPGVYHTFRAISPVVVLLNSKSPAYNEENPDKEKLPLKNDLIPLVWE
jgi:dTDP-4-dehydrorhamnose 3,5-epimerase-like enzyme